MHSCTDDNVVPLSSSKGLIGRGDVSVVSGCHFRRGHLCVGDGFIIGAPRRWKGGGECNVTTRQCVHTVMGQTDPMGPSRLGITHRSTQLLVAERQATSPRLNVWVSESAMR